MVIAKGAVRTLIYIRILRVRERSRRRPRCCSLSCDAICGHEGVWKLELVGEAAVGVRDGIGVAVEAPRVANVVVDEDVDRLATRPTAETPKPEKEQN